MRNTLICLFISCIFLLSGCSQSSSKLTNDEVTLNIGYFSEKQFDNRYAALLSIEYPNLSYNVVPTRNMITEKKFIQEWVAHNNVDLIYLPPNYLQLFASEGLLQNLQFYMQNTSFPIDSYVPSIIELMKLHGEGELYGLAPTFYSRALVYKPQLFDLQGVPYPKDQMTWEETIDLARQFPQGLTLSYPTVAHFLIDVGQTENLQAYSSETDQITLDTPAWKRIMELILEPLQNGHILLHDLNNSPFLTDGYAMAIITYDELIQLEQQGSDFEWRLVTMPTHPSQPDSSHHYALDGMWAIPVNSIESDAAWELIQFFMSEQVAEWSYRSVYGFSSLTAYTSLSSNTTNIDAFYKLKPIVHMNSIPSQIYEFLNEAIEQAVSGEKTVERALGEIPNIQ